MNKTTMVLLVLLTAIVAGGVVYLIKPSTVVKSSVTVEQMKKIAQLATTEYTLGAFAEQEYKSQSLFKKVVSDYAIAKVTGKVKGSVDLEKATIDVQESKENPQVSIHFKRGSVLISGVEIDPNDKEAEQVISCREKLKLKGLLNPISPSQRDALQRIAKQEIAKAAIKVGIVEKTMGNAKTALSDFVGALGYRANITFDERAYDPPKSGG